MFTNKMLNVSAKISFKCFSNKKIYYLMSDLLTGNRLKFYETLVLLTNFNYRFYGLLEQPLVIKCENDYKNPFHVTTYLNLFFLAE